jgi:hypothetical protein
LFTASAATANVPRRGERARMVPLARALDARLSGGDGAIVLSQPGAPDLTIRRVGAPVAKANLNGCPAPS